MKTEYVLYMNLYIFVEILQKIFSRRPSSEYYNLKEYTGKITKYIYQFIFENQPIEKVLNEITDLTEIHYISISNKDTKLVALIFLIIVIVIGILLLIPLPLLYVKKYESFSFIFLKDHGLQ